MAAIWIFSRHAVFGDFSTPKTKRCFGIKVRHWINLYYDTDLWSLPRLLTEICPFKTHFQAYFHFHGFSGSNFQTFFLFLHFFSKFLNPPPKNIHNSLFYSFKKTQAYKDIFHGKLIKLENVFSQMFLSPMSFQKPIQKFGMDVGEVWQLKF